MWKVQFCSPKEATPLIRNFKSYYLLSLERHLWISKTETISVCSAKKMILFNWMISSLYSVTYITAHNYLIAARIGYHCRQTKIKHVTHPYFYSAKFGFSCSLQTLWPLSFLYRWPQMNLIFRTQMSSIFKQFVQWLTSFLQHSTLS